MSYLSLLIIYLNTQNISMWYQSWLSYVVTSNCVFHYNNLLYERTHRLTYDLRRGWGRKAMGGSYTTDAIQPKFCNVRNDDFREWNSKPICTCHIYSIQFCQQIFLSIDVLWFLRHVQRFYSYLVTRLPILSCCLIPYHWQLGVA